MTLDFVLDDVLVFQTEPLEADLEVTGPIAVRLFVSSSAPDTDFTAKLIDLHPPSVAWPGGFAMNLTDSATSRASTSIRTPANPAGSKRACRPRPTPFTWMRRTLQASLST